MISFPKTPCLFTGIFTVFYTLFVYFDVLLKKDQDWKWIIAIFCGTWIGIYLMKMAMDKTKHPNQLSQHFEKIVFGLVIFNAAAANTKHSLLNLARRTDHTDDTSDFNVFLAATSMFAAYFLLIRKPAKECEWDRTVSWKYDPVPYFLAVCQLLFLYLPLVDEKVKGTDRNMFIFHQVALSVIWVFSCFELCAVMMENLKLKEEEPVERQAPKIENPVVDEGISLTTIKEMQCPLIGLSALLYTSFVYYDVLFKADQDFKWLLIIFCMIWTGVYLVKRALDRYPYPNQSTRHTTMITAGSSIISMVAVTAQYQLIGLTKQCDGSTATTVFFAANVFFAAYFLLMRQAKECLWSKRSRNTWLLEAIRFLMIVAFASGILDKNFDECVMDRNVYYFHQFIFSIMIGCAGYNMFSTHFAKLELKEDLEREAAAAALIESPTEVKNAAEGVVIEKEAIQG